MRIAKNKKRIVSRALFALAAVSAVSSCGTEKIVVVAPTAPPTVATTVRATTTTEAAPPTTVYVSIEEEFLQSVKRETSLEYRLSDEQMIEIARLMCDSFSSGSSLSDVVTMITNAANATGLTQNQLLDLGTLIGSGVAYFCPENGYLLQ